MELIEKDDAGNITAIYIETPSTNKEVTTRVDVIVSSPNVWGISRLMSVEVTQKIE